MIEFAGNESVPARPEGERDLVASRVFDAPRELVFDTWTNPEHISNWWGPRGFSTTTERIDVRPGGEWIFVMHGPDGRDYANRVVYEQVNRPERLVYRHDGGDGEGGNGVAFEVTVQFIAENDSTRIVMRMRFDTGRMRDEAAQFGAVEGLDDTLSRLGEQLAVLQRETAES